MRHYTIRIIFFLFLLSSNLHLPAQTNAFTQQVHLLKNHRIPEFVTGFTPDNKGSEFFQPFIYHYSGQFDLSENAFKKLYLRNISDSNYISKLVEIRVANMLHLSRYAELVNFLDSVIKADPGKVDEEMLNNQKIANALKSAKPLTVSGADAEKIKLKSDMAGLFRLPVNFEKGDEDFIFDTGANMSVISESNARKYKLTVTNDTILVGSASGKKVKAFIAVSDEIQIGKIKFQNIPFLVLPDDALSFLGGLYKIHGIVGLNIIRMMNRVEINTASEMIIDRTPAVSSNRNMYFDGLNLIAEVKINDHEKLPCFIDFGAKETSLSVKSNSFFDLTGLPQDSKKVGGAGGSSKFKIYTIPVLKIGISDKTVELKNTPMYTETQTGAKEKYYGIIGIDLFKKKRTAILDFENGEFLIRD